MRLQTFLFTVQRLLHLCTGLHWRVRRKISSCTDTQQGFRSIGVSAGIGTTDWHIITADISLLIFL